MRQLVDSYDGPLKEIIVYCMIEKGNDPDKCFECGETLTDRTREIHHLKYEGATISDLRFGCTKCNMKAEYKNLV